MRLSPQQWQRFRSIVEQVDDCTLERRAALLDEATAGDDELRAAVESALDGSDVPNAFLRPIDSGLAGAVIAESAVREAVGRRIGPYRLTEVAAVGGMGTVYRAERDDGQFSKQVAVKLLHGPLNSPEAKRRFACEQQALATLEHPNIARLLDAGTAQDGTAYLVMELVDGEPIDEYCDGRDLGVRARLELFRSVCSAVSYAHQNLIVHRDLKPGNILVTVDGAPKLVDFGIARILDEAGADGSSDATITELRAMTPQYGSPEQIRGEKIATVSEVYSLGVVLYELLSGTRPYDLRGRTPTEVERIVCEKDPPPPSSVVAAPDGRRRLAGDLDTIVRKAMHKDAARRYASVQQLSDDIGRYLDGFPVVARRDSLNYRAAKFVRRHRAGVTAVALIFLSLTAGLIGTLAGLTRARSANNLASAEARRAAREADKASQVARFVQELLASADPMGPSGSQVTLRELLDTAGARIDTELTGHPQVQAVLNRMIGASYLQLGLFKDAEPRLWAAVDYHRSAAQSDQFERADAMESLGVYLSRNLAVAEAETWFRSALKIRAGAEANADTARLLTELAGALAQMGRRQEAEKHLREALAIRDSQFGRRHSSIVSSHQLLARLFMRTGDEARAESAYREAVALARELKSHHRMAVVQPLLDLSLLLQHQDRIEQAESALIEAHETAASVLSPWHYVRMTTAHRLGGFLIARKRFEEAEIYVRQTYDALREHVGADHPSTNALRSQLVKIYEALGRNDAIAALADEPTESAGDYDQSIRLQTRDARSM